MHLIRLFFYFLLQFTAPNWELSIHSFCIRFNLESNLQNVLLKFRIWWKSFSIFEIFSKNMIQLFTFKLHQSINRSLGRYRYIFFSLKYYFNRNVRFCFLCNGLTCLVKFRVRRKFQNRKHHFTLWIYLVSAIKKKKIPKQVFIWI